MVEAVQTNVFHQVETELEAVLEYYGEKERDTSV